MWEKVGIVVGGLVLVVLAVVAVVFLFLLPIFAGAALGVFLAWMAPAIEARALATTGFLLWEIGAALGFVSCFFRGLVKVTSFGNSGEKS